MLSFIVTGVFATNACAQDAAKQYKTIPTSAKFRDIDVTDLEGEAKRIAAKENAECRRQRTAGKTASRECVANGDIAGAKGFLNGFIYPRMTQVELLADAGTMRDAFFRTYMRSDLTPQNRRQLIDSSVLPAMKTIANGADYYPAARLNAIAMIARLDDRGLSRNGSQTVPPIPSSAALEFLATTLTSAQTPSYLKAAVMQGLTRFLKIDRAAKGRIIDNGIRNNLTQFALNTIQDKTPGQDKWDADLNYWLKRRSVQMLGEIGKAGSGGSNVDLLLQIAGDASQTLWMQLDAIKALRTIDMAGLNADKSSKVVLAVTDFLQRSLDQEAARIKGLVDDLVYKNILYGDVDLEVKGTSYEKNAGKSGGMGMMGMGGGFMDDFDDESAMGMGMGGSSTRGGMSGSGMKSGEPAILVELPTYQLNLVRRRMKVLAHTSNDVLSQAPGLAQVIGEKEKQLVSKVAKFTQKFMKDSDTGIINVDEVDMMREPKTESYTSQLTEICHEGAGNVRRIVAAYSGNAGGVIEASAPESGPIDPLNGLNGLNGLGG